MKLKKTDTLIIASHNKGKISEFYALLHGLPFKIKNALELGLNEPKETGSTFTENALLKARAATEATGYPSIADDSGLVVLALDGEPGIHSARWGGPEKDYKIAMARIENKLKAKKATDFSAKWVCTLAFCLPDGMEAAFTGELAGTLTFPPRGNDSSGYGPIFIAEGLSQTHAEISRQLRDTLHPRGEAFKKLQRYLNNE
ncbi:MAG TPA: non-canonical purine NTP pyrophosphatase [Gammaproteobacteria bacterium]|nr:non-canonical purine NTP pyrophosphatase [Gammaproteobacteria bacterium]